MMERRVIISLTVLALVNLIDAISFMAVAPSLIFYVTDLGGTKEQYGLIMSAFSFASFCLKPVYGRWVDATNNKYKIPYLVSFSLAIFGNLLYFSAILLPAGNSAVYTLLMARSFAGAGAANNALGYSYIATVIPHENQTRTNVMLSMARIIGMTLGPFVNLGLSKIDRVLSIGNSFEIPLNPNNSVGLVVAAGQFMVLLTALIFLEEPPEKPEELKCEGQKPGMKEIWEAVTDIDVMLPVFIIFVVNCNFQLIETAFPPASAHGLGWGPVETSAVLGANSLTMFFLMALVMFLSFKKVSDTLLVVVGNMCWAVGGVLVYHWWTYQAEEWKFVLPIFLCISGFPFVAPTNRSNFTKAVKSKPELESAQSMMQAILSMATSVAGFLAPSLVAVFIIRRPEDVEASTDKRELSPVALYIPIVSMICNLGLWYEYVEMKRREKKQIEAEGVTETELLPSERSKLLPAGAARASRASGRRRSSVVEINQAFSRQNEVRRHQSVEVMGVPCPFDTNDENADREKLWHDKKEWEELQQMGDLESHEFVDG